MFENLSLRTSAIAGRRGNNNTLCTGKSLNNINFSSTSVALQLKPLVRPTSAQVLAYFTGSKKPVKSIVRTNQTEIKDLISQISYENLKNHVYTLASNEFEGRKPGTEGGRKAQAYITNLFKEYGLKPLTTLNGDKFEQKAVFQNVFQKGSPDDEQEPSSYMASPGSLDFNNRELDINNVIGYLPGRNNSDKYLFIMAHYDHLGKKGNNRISFQGLIY